MNQSASGYVNKRVLKLNVGFLLSDGPGRSHDSELDIPALRVADDLMVRFLTGPIRLSRTKEGILVQATLDTAVEAECDRCLDPIHHQMTIELEELFSTQAQRDAEFVIDDDGILDLSPLLRAEILIDQSHGVVCREDCLGLCPTCGVNRNHEHCDCDMDDIDPRLAALKELLDSN